MTVNTTNITSGPYPGNGSSNTFSYTFRVEDKTQLKVFETDAAGVETTLVVDTDYTVGNIGVDIGGIITRVAGNLPTGYTWYIRSDYKTTQLTAFGSQGGFFPYVHEDMADKITFLIQQLYDLNARTFRISDSDTDVSSIVALPPAATRANKVLSFDTVGDLITILELGVWRADWLTATAYKYRDMFRDPATNTVYHTQVAHTSTNVVADLASNYISVLLDGNPATTNFVPRTSTTGSAIMPSGTTAQRDGAPGTGYQRWNTTLGYAEEWNGTVWQKVGDTVPSITDNGNALAINIDASEDVQFKGTVQFAAGQGVVFNGDAIAAANTLDDYEEGNWTPDLKDASNTATPQGANGFYTKVGNLVYISGTYNATNAATVLGNNLRITGLPFACAGGFDVINFGNVSNVAIVAGQSINGISLSSSAMFMLYLWDSTAGQTGLTGAEFADIGLVRFSGIYRTTL